MPTACRMPTALIGKMPDADGIAKTRHNDQYNQGYTTLLDMYILNVLKTLYILQFIIIFRKVTAEG